MKGFVSEHEWISKISEIKENTSGKESYRKRFFGWFNMFRIVKYLNYAHKTILSKVPVEDAVKALLALTGSDPVPETPLEMLKMFREDDRRINSSLS